MMAARNPDVADEMNPLLERIRFLSIVGSNLNEFFMVRVASLNAQLDAGIAEFGPDRMSLALRLDRFVEPSLGVADFRQREICGRQIWMDVDHRLATCGSLLGPAGV